MEQPIVEIPIEQQDSPDSNRILPFVRAVLTVVLAYGLTSVLFKLFKEERFAFPLMISIIALFAVTLVFALIRGAKIRFFSIAALLLGLSAGAYAWLNEELFFPVYIASHVVVLSYPFFILSLFGNANDKLSGGTFLLDVVKATFVYPFLSFWSIVSALFQWKSEKKRAGKILLYTLIGIAAAVVLGIIAILLLSFDPAFKKLFTFEWEWKNLFEVFEKLIICIPLSFLLFSVFTSSENRRLPNMSSPETASRVGTRMKKLHPVIFLIPAAVLFIIYGLFFFTQWDVYMSAFSGVLPKSYTAAEYARSGFFELCAVASINAVVGILMALLMDESSNAAVILKKITNTILAFATLILIATALSKMILYIHRFDLTVLRLFTSVTLILIAIGFLVSVLSQWIPQVKTMPVLIVIVSVLLLILPFLNVNGRIAKYNVDAYLQREAQNDPDNSIDISYLVVDLGDAGIPDAVCLLESGTLSEKETNSLNKMLMDRYDALSQLGPFEKSLASHRAFKAMNQVKTAPLCLINGTYPVVFEEYRHSEEDSWSDYFGDRYHYIEIDCSKDTAAAHAMVSSWKPLPMSDKFMNNVKDNLDWSESSVFSNLNRPEENTQNGVYWFYNLADYQNDPADDSVMEYDRWIKFRLAVYDYDTEKLYYLELQSY